MEKFSYEAIDQMETPNNLLQIKSYEARDQKGSPKNQLKIKMIELAKAKDHMTQSWLDSRPLIDELEKLQSSLAATKIRITMSSTIISELESQLETANKSIRSQKEEESKVRMTINEMNRDLDQTREEMEQLKLENDEERRARSELKQVLRLKKQSLRTLQLTLRAIRLESEAVGASVVESVRYINSSETDNTTVQLSQEEYYTLTRRAKEETSLAEWRVSVSMEQRIVAEASRDSALRRLKELHSDKKIRKMKMKEKLTEDENAKDTKEENSRTIAEIEVNQRQIASPKARTKLIASTSNGSSKQQYRRLRSNKKMVQKRKPSIFVRIRSCLVQKITKWFR